MELIDKEIRQEGGNFPGRELAGVGKFCLRYGIRLSNQDDLTKKIISWFSERYGRRLGLPFPIGESTILIRKEPYKISFPMCFGTQLFECDPSNFKGTPSQNETNSFPTSINILNFIEGMTEGYAKALSHSELQEVFSSYMSLFEAMIEIEAARNTPFVTEAKSDLKASVAHLFDHPISYGLSKWASLQATEKFIKAFIQNKGIPPPEKGRDAHNLTKLAEIAEPLGLSSLKQSDLDKIQCTAGVRYGQEYVTCLEAFEAHQSAFQICAQISPQL